MTSELESTVQLLAARRAKEPAGYEQIWDWLERIGVSFAVGMVIAGAIAFALERAGGHWASPLMAAPLAGLVWLISPDYGFVLAAALIAAVVIGWQWERQAKTGERLDSQRRREGGGQLARVRGELSRRRHGTQRVRGNRLVLGADRSGHRVTVPFGSADGVRAFVPGAPGSGKTVTLTAHSIAYARRGYGVVAIDPKGDRSFRDALRCVAAECGREFLEWTPEGPTSYNPLARGSALEVTDKALAGEQWTEPHYLRQAQRYLNLELQAMESAGDWPPTLRSVVDHLDPGRLDGLVDRVDGEVGERLRAYLDGLSPRARVDLEGARNRLAVLAESHLGSLLCPSQDRVEIELKGALHDRAIVYFQLDADRFPLASQMLGAAIVSDLVALTGELQGQPKRALILIDEFSAVAAEEVSRLLSRSRSAGLSVLIGTQALADLSLARPGDGTDSLRRQVLSHVDYVVAHRQSEPEAADLLAQMAGTRPAWSVARHVRKTPWGFETTGDATRRKTREFIYHPDEFKRLGTGEAVVIEPASRRDAERVRVWRADAETEKGMRWESGDELGAVDRK
jgi:hypothetical protein